MPGMTAGCANSYTGNVMPLLHEIRHALSRLLESGESMTIDLRSMPLAPGEEEQLESMLGQGEINATLETLGTSDIRETGITGVWLITHRNDEDEILGKFIEITRMPTILMSQAEDIENSLQTLSYKLEQDL